MCVFVKEKKSHTVHSSFVSQTLFTTPSSTSPSPIYCLYAFEMGIQN